jgi:hypothetical protein
VRIRFVLDDNRDTHPWDGENNHRRDGWYIDNIRIDEKDDVAPAAVTDLAASGFTPSSVELGWTAVGDDGNSGRAAAYDVRYSTADITEARWASARQVVGEPAPQPAGFRETLTVSGLPAGTTLYFAVKVLDEEGNPSGLSNVASGATLGEGGASVRVDAPTHVLADRDFTAVIRVSQVDGFDAANYTVQYNESVLQLTNVTAGRLNGADIPVDVWDTGDGTGSAVVVQNVPGTPGVSGSGFLAVLHFHVIGTGNDTSSINLVSGVLGDKEARAIQSQWFGDSVKVVTVLPGDANGDERVDALDITRTEMIIVGVASATPGADANGDGAVNALDITMIERIIARLA